MAIRMTGLVSGMDTESLVKELMNAERLKSTKVQNNITKLEWTQEKWKDLNTKIYSFYTGVLSKARLSSSYLTKKATSSNTSKLDVTAQYTAPTGTHKVKVEAMASAQYVTGAKVEITAATKLTDIGFSEGDEINITVGGIKAEPFKITDKSTVADFIKSLKDAGLNANFDSTHKRIFISSKETGLDNAFTIEANTVNANTENANTENGGVNLAGLGLNEIIKNEDGILVESGNAKMSLVHASDAKFTYNGREFTSSSNNISVNGLNFTIKGITAADEELSITINNDTQAVYDMIKGFVTSYNELLKEMNEAYYADHARGYDPLTDEEKEAMTDEQVEKWEKKIKDSLLRRDNSLYSVINALKTSMGQRVNVNGKNYSLTSFGITSPDYTEKGLLHINGDSESTLVGLKDNELMEALTEDPETVMQVFTELAGNLYNTMTDQMKSTSLSSALTFYNDKQMKNTLDDYKDELSRLEERLSKVEERYYKQFAAMERALSQANSQSSSILSLLGMNTGQ